MPRIRTIMQTVQCLKQQDPGSCVSEWWLRQLIKTGKLKCHKAGNKFLIDLDYLEEFLKNPPSEPSVINEYGKLRQVKQ